MITKAVILAGGKGTRLSVPDMPKSMIKINNKPLLENTLNILNDCGIKTAYILVHYLKNQIIDYFGDNFKGINIVYIDDNEILKPIAPIGIADVLSVMEDKINEPFMMILGDEIYLNTDHKGFIESFNENYEASIGIIHTKDEEAIKKNYTLIVKDGNVTDLEEKPKKAWNDILGCGSYIFKPSIFKAIKLTPLSVKSGKREITDTLRIIISFGLLKAYDLKGKYLNINYPEDLNSFKKLLK